MAKYVIEYEIADKMRKHGFSLHDMTVADFVEYELTAADVAPVVRCKDCKWRGSENCAMFYRCECGEQHTWETDNDYCSYGEEG